MSHFYGWVQGNRGEASRGGSKKSGYDAVAASWDGAIRVRLDYDPKTDKNHYVIYQSKWHGKGVESEIAKGIIGEEDFSNPTHKSDFVAYVRNTVKARYEEGYDAGFADAMGSR